MVYQQLAIELLFNTAVENAVVIYKEQVSTSKKIHRPLLGYREKLAYCLMGSIQTAAPRKANLAFQLFQE